MCPSAWRSSTYWGNRTTALESARDLIRRAKQEMPDEAPRRDVIQLVETVIMYKLANLSREEIQAMLKVDDIRQTRVYREAQEEGRQEGRQEEQALQRQQQLQHDGSTIAKLAQRGMSAAEIADALSLELDFVRQTLAK